MNQYTYSVHVHVHYPFQDSTSAYLRQCLWRWSAGKVHVVYTKIYLFILNTGPLFLHFFHPCMYRRISVHLLYVFLHSLHLLNMFQHFFLIHLPAFSILLLGFSIHLYVLQHFQRNWCMVGKLVPNVTFSSIDFKLSSSHTHLNQGANTGLHLDPVTSLYCTMAASCQSWDKM